MNLEIIIFMLVSTILGAVGSYFFKKGSKHISKKISSFFKLEIFTGVFLYALSTVLYVYLLKKYDLSLIYPLTSLGYIWVMLISKKYLNEKITLYKIISILLIITGVIFIT